MGYSMDLLVDPNVDPEFVCSICKDVLRDPIFLDPCDHQFCKVCINTWTASGSGPTKCPIDRRRIRDCKAPPRPFMNMLNGLKLKCQFVVNGCDKVTTLGDMAEHLRKCEVNPEFKLNCPKGCGAVVKKILLNDHSCVDFRLGKLERHLQSLNKMVEDQAAEIKKLVTENKKQKLQIAKLICDMHGPDSDYS